MLNDSELLITNLCNEGYHIQDNFLTIEKYDLLRNTAQALYDKNQFRNAKIGLKCNLHENDLIRTDKIAWVEDQNNTSDVLYFIKLIQNLISHLNSSLFLGIKEMEIHFASYLPGTYYKKHSDQFHSQKTRQISFVYYLNDQWQEQDGGLLQLYDTNDQIIQRVLPLKNRFICFRSDLIHEVIKTEKVRLSIAGWLKTRS